MPSRYELSTFSDPAASTFSLDRVTFERRAPQDDEVEVEVRAISLNYRDLMILRGQYNPKLALPAVPISDGAGQVTALGPGVHGLAPGDRVLTNFASTWESGPFRASYLAHTLGTPGPGLATQYAYLPRTALVKIPEGLDFAQASTLPIAGLTAFSALVTEGQTRPGQLVLTLGTGGVSMFVLQLAQRLGAKVAITSSSDDKLARCKEMGAALTLNYRRDPRWGKTVADWALAQRDNGEAGVDLVVETGGAQTLDQSIRATRAGGRLAILGALTGLEGSIHLGPIMMRRISLHGIMVDSRAALMTLLELCTDPTHGKPLTPEIAQRFSFDELPEALRTLARGEHQGKIVVEHA